MPPKPRKRSASTPPVSRVDRTTGQQSRLRSKSLNQKDQAPGAQPPIILPGNGPGQTIPTLPSKRGIIADVASSGKPSGTDRPTDPDNNSQTTSTDIVKVGQGSTSLAKATNAAFGADLRKAWAVDGSSPNNKIIAQLRAHGHTPDSMVEKVIMPFVNGDGHFPGTMAADVQRIMRGIFDSNTGMLNLLVSDNLLGDMFDGPRTVEACAEVAGRVRKFLIGQLDVASYYSSVVQEIPHDIHFVWTGRPISADALKNLIAWAKACKGTTWTITMWSDLAISDWKTGNAGKKLQAAGIVIKDARPIIDTRLMSAYKTALVNKGLASCSDFFRWSLFTKTGGVYMDVDIAPGRVDLSTLSCQASQVSEPLYAPGLRDLGTVRAILGMGPDEPVTAEQIQLAVDIQIKQGVINSNFVALQTGSMFVDPMINEMARKTAKMEPEDWATAGGMVAGVTGPTMLMGVTGDINAIKLQVTPELGFELLQNKYVCKWPLGWLTAESENQDWSLGKKPTDKK